MKKYKEVRSLAFRYNKGPSGGPGGSNSLIELWNERYKIIPNLKCFYREPFFRNKILSKIFKYLNIISRIILKIELIEKLEERKYIRRSLASSSKSVLFLVHDVWTCRQLFQRGKEYILIYHQQGSTVEEAKSLGRKLSNSEEKEMVKTERIAFLNAKKVVFTAEGALKSYMKTSKLKRSELEKIKDNSSIIYNTCMVYDELKKPREYSLIERKGERQIILTVSSLSRFKGVDQIPSFLNSLKNFRKEFIWVLCGKGHLKDKIFKEVERYSLTENYIYIERRMPQEELSYICENATYYLMMHRLSIFDLATLEAMSHRCIPILSSVGGNLEFNKEQNVIFTEEAVDRKLERRDKRLDRKSILNEKVFYKYFGPKILLDNIYRLIREEGFITYP
jgi:glycosyltransferase involved in cell wall biosynthesis